MADQQSSRFSIASGSGTEETSESEGKRESEIQSATSSGSVSSMYTSEDGTETVTTVTPPPPLTRPNLFGRDTPSSSPDRTPLPDPLRRSVDFRSPSFVSNVSIRDWAEPGPSVKTNPARGCVRKAFAKLLHPSRPSSKVLRRRRSVTPYYSNTIQTQRKAGPDVWMKLDGEAWERILLYLPIQDVLAVKRVNRKLESTVKRRSLWIDLLCRDFSTEVPSKDNVPVLPRTASTFEQLRIVPANRVRDLESVAAKRLEETYKLYFIRTNKKRLEAYEAWQKAKSRKRNYVCCAIFRCIADFQHFICLPFALGAFGISSLALLGVKLNDDSAFGWWAVLLPVQILIGLSCLTLAQAVLARTLSPVDRTVEEYFVIESEATPCGGFLENINYDDCCDPPAKAVAIGCFFASFLSLTLFVVLLSLKLEDVVDTPWSHVLVPFEIAILLMPASVIFSANADDMEEALAIMGISTFMVFLPIMLTTLLFGLRVDGFASLAMWEVFMPILLSLGLIWIGAIVGVVMAIRDSLEDDEFTLRETVGYGLLGGLIATIVIGILGSQAILFIVFGDTDKLDGANYLKLFVPMLIVSCLFCLLIWGLGAVYASDYYDTNNFFSDGFCKYLAPGTMIRRKIRENNQVLDNVTVE
eukprot:gb/GECG01014754.1/.p1 GENE.gb/GECG01014754.1/~~gb/GECG01014754.1/.p1  ORF type:complete len:641 (+),score=54.25 gb/GECG01014754.1/:1-1923(+)